MSSAYLSSDDLTMIERLLAEVRASEPERSFDIETTQAHLFIYAFADGISVESDLRSLLAKHIAPNSSVDRSSRRWRVEAVAFNHRQEHMLPSPEEEFNAAKAIHSMAAAPHDGKPLVGRNAPGETAMIYWVPDGGAADRSGYWARLDDGKRFEAVHWVRTTWTVTEVLEHSSVGPSR